jgi:ribonuclease R
MAMTRVDLTEQKLNGSESCGIIIITMGRKHSKKKNKERLVNHEQSLNGTLDISRSGVGFVMVENLPVDVVVRPGDFNTALHGDTVTVKIKEQKKNGRRMHGEVVDVLRRKQTEFMGKMQMGDGFGFFIAETERPMPDIFIPRQNFNGAKDHDRVVVRILEWEKDGKRPVGEVVTVMDEEDSNDVAMKEILLENGFPLEFPEDALEEASRIPDTISNEEINRRKDVRDILTFTIDPIDAKDFDDAISFRLLKNGNYEMGVHIADVAHYVEQIPYWTKPLMKKQRLCICRTESIPCCRSIFRMYYVRCGRTKTASLSLPFFKFLRKGR